MKKIFLWLLIIFMLEASALSAYAMFSNPPLIDNADCLTSPELIELSSQLDGIRERYCVDVCIYTEAEMCEGTADASAEYIYDNGKWGAGESGDGIMLYICRDTGEYHLNVHGRCVEIFNSNGLAYIESGVVPYLSQNGYYKAFETYIKITQELLDAAETEAASGKKRNDNKLTVYVVAGCLLPPLCAVVLIATKKRKGGKN